MNIVCPVRSSATSFMAIFSDWKF